MTGTPKTEDRLLAMLDDELLTKHAAWKITPGENGSFAAGGHRMLSPTEPCDRCGQVVFLILTKGQTKPMWLMLGDIDGGDTLFPKVKTKRHTCGDGDSRSVEAALFVDSALREWEVTA